jgi:acetyltransferase-like isoleucine patch superfamily enzyme
MGATIVGNRLRKLRAVPRLLFREFRQFLRHRSLARRGVDVDSSAVIMGRCEIIGRVRIGARTVVNQSLLDGRGGLDIGHDVFVGHATIVTATHDLDDPHFKTVYRPVVIEPFAVIFRNATILPGRTIGRGGIVASGAVVSNDVAPMTVVAGNPARVIRERKAVHELADIRRMSGYVGHDWRQFASVFASDTPPGRLP